MHDNTQPQPPGPEAKAVQEFYFVLRPADARGERPPRRFGPFASQAQAEVLRASARAFGLIAPH